MDIQALKLELVEKILQTDEPSLLLKIEKLFRKNEKDDWWEQLPPEVQDAIVESLDEIEDGKVFTHEQVIRETKERYGF
jgi:hypothetical protein